MSIEILDTLEEKYTLQTAFDRVCEWLLRDGATQSAIKGNEGLGSVTCCKYRGLNGNCCAVGILIPNDLYDPKFEGLGICGLDLKGLPVESLFEDELEPETIVAFLKELQRIHDIGKCWCPNTGESLRATALRGTARAFNLTFPKHLEEKCNGE